MMAQKTGSGAPTRAMAPKSNRVKSNRAGRASPPTKGVSVAEEVAAGSSAGEATDEIQTTGESTRTKPTYVTAGKLKLRVGAELTSAEVGFVAGCALVCVVKMTTLEDGTQRHCLANEGETNALGWITATGKDGSPNLTPVAPPASATPAPTSAAASMEDVSLAKKTGTNKKSASAKSSSRVEKVDAKPSTRKGEKWREVTAKAKSAGKAAADVPLLTSAELREQAVAIGKEADAHEESSFVKKKPLKVLIGESLIRTNSTINELVQSWAKGGTGDISKMDFRKHIRKIVDSPNVVEVDALFCELDADGGGTLDVGELKAAFKKLQQEVVNNSGLVDDMMAKIAILRERAADVESVAATTEQAEKAEAQFSEIRDKVGVRAKLGKLFAKSSLKIDATVVASWTAANGEKRPDGELDCIGFRVNVRSMGMPNDVTDAEVDGLFGELDSDGGGTLDFKELQASLKKLQDASTAANAELVKFKKSSAEFWKMARAQQAELKRKQKQLEQEELDAAKRLEQEKAMAEAEARVAKEAKLAAAKAAKEAKEKEKAEFDAKIAARRAGARSPQPEEQE